MRIWLQNILWEARALPQAQASLRREHSGLRTALNARGLEITPLWAVRAYAIAPIGLSHLLEGQMDKAFELLFDAYVQDPDYPFTGAGLCIAAAARGDRKTAREVGKRLIATGKDEQVLRMLQNPVHRAMFSHALASATVA